MEIQHLQDYALLRTGTFSLLLPQSQVKSVEHIENRTLAKKKSIAEAAELASHIADDEIAFVSLSEKLEILSELSGNSFVQTTWTIAPKIHWCWTEVKWLNQVDLKTAPIPKVLQTPELPAQSIVTLEDGSFTFICDAQALLNYILYNGGH